MTLNEVHKRNKNLGTLPSDNCIPTNGPPNLVGYINLKLVKGDIERRYFTCTYESAVSNSSLLFLEQHWYTFFHRYRFHRYTSPLIVNNEAIFLLTR